MVRIPDAPPTSRDTIHIPRRRRGLGFVIAAAAALAVVAVIVAAAWAGIFAKDETPPRLALTVPAEGAKYAGVIHITGSVADESDLASFRLLLDGADRTPALDLAKRRTLKFKFKLDTALLADGKHEVAVAAADVRGNEATRRAAFYVENHATVLKLAFEPPRVDQGRVVVVKLVANKKLYNLEGKFWDQKFPFFPVADGFESIVGVRASCPPGDYPVAVAGFDAYDQPLDLRGTVTVADGGYIKEEIEIAAPEKQKLLTRRWKRRRCWSIVRRRPS